MLQACTQVTRRCVSGTTSHTTLCIGYYKSHDTVYQVLRVTNAMSDHAMKIKGLHDKINVTMVIKLY